MLDFPSLQTWLIERHIFQQMRVKPAKLKKVFAAAAGEMYPVSLCVHDLPDAFGHVAAGSWPGLTRSAWMRSVF